MAGNCIPLAFALKIIYFFDLYTFYTYKADTETETCLWLQHDYLNLYLQCITVHCIVRGFIAVLELLTKIFHQQSKQPCNRTVNKLNTLNVQQLLCSYHWQCLSHISLTLSSESLSSRLIKWLKCRSGFMCKLTLFSCVFFRKSSPGSLSSSSQPLFIFKVVHGWLIFMKPSSPWPKYLQGFLMRILHPFTKSCRVQDKHNRKKLAAYKLRHQESTSVREKTVLPSISCQWEIHSHSQSGCIFSQWSLWITIKINGNNSSFLKILRIHICILLSNVFLHTQIKGNIPFSKKLHIINGMCREVIGTFKGK